MKQDIHLSDNLGITKVSRFDKTLPIYIESDVHHNQLKIGRVNQLYCHHSLESLNQSLDQNLHFRVFNYITQSKKFDPNGLYNGKFVLEIRLLSDKYLFKS